MNQPLISIIIPCYNVEEYLPKCINSIINQTYRNLEIILVDDGSSDSCGQICDEYAAKDARIKVIHKENGGQSDARNVAIDIAKGEYITFVDSDDYVTGDYVEVLYSLIEKYGCKVSAALHQTFSEGEEPDLSRDANLEICQPVMKAIEDMLYQKWYDTAPWAKMYHRSLFGTDIRYPKVIIFEDLATTYLLFAKAESVAFSNKKIYCYLLRSNSSEGATFTPFKMDSALRVFDSFDLHRDITDKVRKAYNCRMMSFMFHILLKMPKGYDKASYLKDRIKAIRWSVLCDSRARKKARVAALLSYLGMNTVRCIFKFVDERK